MYQSLNHVRSMLEGRHNRRCLHKVGSCTNYVKNMHKLSCLSPIRADQRELEFNTARPNVRIQWRSFATRWRLLCTTIFGARTEGMLLSRLALRWQVSPDASIALQIQQPSPISAVPWSPGRPRTGTQLPSTTAHRIETAAMPVFACKLLASPGPGRAREPKRHNGCSMVAFGPTL